MQCNNDCEKIMKCKKCGKTLSKRKNRREKNIKVRTEQRSGEERRNKCRHENCKVDGHYTLIADEENYCPNCWDK